MESLGGGKRFLAVYTISALSSTRPSLLINMFPKFNFNTNTLEVILFLITTLQFPSFGSHSVGSEHGR